MPANLGGPADLLGVRAVAVALRILRLAATALLPVGLGMRAITVALRILGSATTAHFGGRGRLIRRSCHKFHLRAAVRISARDNDILPAERLRYFFPDSSASENFRASLPPPARTLARRPLKSPPTPPPALPAAPPAPSPATSPRSAPPARSGSAAATSAQAAANSFLSPSASRPTPLAALTTDQRRPHRALSEG